MWRERERCSMAYIHVKGLNIDLAVGSFPILHPV